MTEQKRPPLWQVMNQAYNVSGTEAGTETAPAKSAFTVGEIMKIAQPFCRLSVAADYPPLPVKMEFNEHGLVAFAESLVTHYLQRREVSDG